MKKRLSDLTSEKLNLVDLMDAKELKNVIGGEECSGGRVSCTGGERVECSGRISGALVCTGYQPGNGGGGCLGGVRPCWTNSRIEI